MSILTKTLSTAVLAVACSLALTGCSGGEVTKPTKEEVRVAFAKAVGEEADSELGKKAVDCMVDKVYDQLSTETLRAMADEDPLYKASPEEEKQMETAAAECIAEVMK